MLIIPPSIPNTEDEFNIPNLLTEKRARAHQIAQELVLCEICGNGHNDCSCTIDDALRASILKTMDKQLHLKKLLDGKLN